MLSHRSPITISLVNIPPRDSLRKSGGEAWFQTRVDHMASGNIARFDRVEPLERQTDLKDMASP
jgi:hypothetical protein